MVIYSGFTWIYPLKMVNFHSYVSLPEGNGFGKAASPDEDTSKKIAAIYECSSHQSMV